MSPIRVELCRPASANTERLRHEQSSCSGRSSTDISISGLLDESVYDLHPLVLSLLRLQIRGRPAKVVDRVGTGGGFGDDGGPANGEQRSRTMVKRSHRQEGHSSVKPLADLSGVHVKVVVMTNESSRRMVVSQAVAASMSASAFAHARFEG